MTTLPLGDAPLQLQTLASLMEDLPPPLSIAPEAARRVEQSRRAVDAAVRSGAAIYGINTGFGKLADVRVSSRDLRALQRNLVRSHCAGVGPPLPVRVCRLAFALRIANVARGFSGVRLGLVEHAIAVFNAGVVPILPSQGSVGASGDLAPLAHMAAVLIGEGRAWVDGEELDGADALASVGLEPIDLRAKEGLALLNGTQVSTAILADAALRARRVARVADVACALSVEGFRGTATAFDARIHALRPHRGSQHVASNLRRLLEGSARLYGPGEGRIQDPYSFRCAPQVHGASRDLLEHIEGVVVREAGSVTDNPIVTEEGDVLSGGNFHAQPVALAADMLKIAIAEYASIAERRIENLVNPDLSGLPAFLARRSGLQSGLMIAQVTAAALVSENKVLAHPASVDTVPTSAGKEDHVSMATHAARHASAIVEHTTTVLAIELCAAFHALALETEAAPAPATRAVRRVLRGVLAPLRTDRVLSGDFEAVGGLIADGSLVAAAERVVGALD